MDEVLALQWVKLGVVIVIILALLWMSRRQPAIARQVGLKSTRPRYLIFKGGLNTGPQLFFRR